MTRKVTDKWATCFFFIFVFTLLNFLSFIVLLLIFFIIVNSFLLYSSLFIYTLTSCVNLSF
ncbi:hypothetical protein BY996DRAFT_6697822 [Phakopsora pachyrhizi]|nr:hypothetical protein BY996DRAFT_6697822 [Phakopsora pachyrhizi]